MLIISGAIVISLRSNQHRRNRCVFFGDTPKSPERGNHFESDQVILILTIFQQTKKTCTIAGKWPRQHGVTLSNNYIDMSYHCGMTEVTRRSTSPHT